MTPRRKLVVALTMREAERIRDAFGLHPDEWMTTGFLASLRGYQFDRIVASLPNQLDDARIKDAVQHLSGRLAEGGELHFI